MTGFIVELFGMPGAGKTYFAQVIADRLQSEGLVVRLATEAIPKRRFGWSWLVNGLSARTWVALHPVYCWQFSQLLARTDQANASESKRMFWAWVKTLARQNRLRKSNVVTLQDHGCWQLLWSIGYGANRWRETLPLLADYVIPSDILIVVGTSNSAACERLVERRKQHGATSRLQNEDLSSEHVHTKLNQLLRPIIDLIDDPDRQNELCVIHIDNTESTNTESNLGVILDTVKRLMPS